MDIKNISKWHTTNSIYVDSLNKFIEAVNHIYDDWKSPNKWECQKCLFFRGHNSIKWELKPSIFRRNVTYNEREIVLDFHQYSPHHTVDYNLISDIDKMLVEMQHYEIPTRLLDWSTSPLNALFFACSSNTANEDDAVVYVMNPWNAYKLILGTLSKKIPSTYMNISIESRSLLSLNWKYSEIKEYIQNKYSYEIDFKELEYALPFVARFRNDRIYAQRGTFTIWGANNYYSLDYQMPYSTNVRKIIINKNSKESILTELNRLSINEYSVYPDYKGMSDLIKRKKGLFNI